MLNIFTLAGGKLTLPARSGQPATASFGLRWTGTEEGASLLSWDCSRHGHFKLI